ncbi:hypothetical protein, partial [Bradyrhizobium sp.]|uniref:hypothetical protein n=1 Tax=Bradyrhizobium sp. TaxID=376 RepID=UPI003C79B5D5
MFKWAKQPGCKFVTVLSLELSDLRGRDVASPARGRRRRLAARETGAKGRNRAIAHCGTSRRPPSRSGIVHALLAGAVHMTIPAKSVMTTDIVT